MNIIKNSITKWDIKNINFTYQYDIIDFPYSDIQFFLLKYLLIIKKKLGIRLSMILLIIFIFKEKYIKENHQFRLLYLNYVH